MLASGWRPAFAGRECLPAGHLLHFSSCYGFMVPNAPGFAWRDVPCRGAVHCISPTFHIMGTYRGGILRAFAQQNAQMVLSETAENEGGGMNATDKTRCLHVDYLDAVEVTGTLRTGAVIQRIHRNPRS